MLRDFVKGGEYVPKAGGCRLHHCRTRTVEGPALGIDLGESGAACETLRPSMGHFVGVDKSPYFRPYVCRTVEGSALGTDLGESGAACETLRPSMGHFVGVDKSPYFRPYLCR
ncbi:hypothetical protein HPB52_010684 [Rhipicephalus sanguineus]|uniref:Uncharacterized protein n=1 Tax=Rhipicephalus sanguineus TaxID=34632 RepID=A0A9D4T1S4_RHISA|nr:hypothetical protein HPB52_010684 [Rhipicephalus sanguineus]